MRVLLILVVALAIPAAALGAHGNVPNPCKLLTRQTASKDLGAPAKAYPQTSNSGARHCLYIASTGRLDLEIGSRSEYVTASAATSPRGTVIKKLPFGENGGLVVAPLRPHGHFVLAAFELGAYYYSVNSEQLSATKIRALAASVYKQLTG